MSLFFYNTLHRRKELFIPIHPGQVSLYSCGPTVYAPAHIGNLRAYIFSDVLKRVIQSSHLNVMHAMNITDVGHLVDDEDGGEDKSELEAKREGLDPLLVAQKYETLFWSDFDQVNCIKPDKIIRATETINEQIELIKALDSKGFVYKTEQALYFDTSKLDDYGKLTGQKIGDKKTGARSDVVVDANKKNPSDFALWFFLVGRYENHILHWSSPWGEGFPGWHVECSAISREALGQPFDIHTGGVDHIGTHHTNEIAQSEAAYGQPLAHVWMHNEHLLVDERKMSKSLGNVYTLADIVAKGFSPLDFRYLCLMAHYRSKMNFTWDALGGARKTRLAVLQQADEKEINEKDADRIRLALADDLDTPTALAVLHEANSSKLWQAFESVFDLGFTSVESVPDDVNNLLVKRQQVRDNKDWNESDRLRDEIATHGYRVIDGTSGQSVLKL